MPDLERSRLPSPFAIPSWEPRFAIDGHRDLDKLLRLALRLQLAIASSGYAYVEGSPVFCGYRVSRKRIAVMARLSSFPRALTRDPDGILFEEVTLDTAVRHIRKWLSSEAYYPPQPWFDGGEERGLQAYHVPYAQESDVYGYLIVEPKWFELHQ